MKFNKIHDKTLSLQVMGQTNYYRTEACNCSPDEIGTCWHDCHFTNYFYGADDTKVPDIQLHCILYLDYYNSETSIFM